MITRQLQKLIQKRLKDKKVIIILGPRQAGKTTLLQQITANRYFWRTHDRQEIDYVEEKDGKLFAFEFKWNQNSKAKFPKVFTRTYPVSETLLITPGNFEEFISPPSF